MQVRKPACNWLYMLCSRELERMCGSMAFLSRLWFYCAGRLITAVPFVGTAVFLLACPRENP
jgi:hypothetical protein